MTDDLIYLPSEFYVLLIHSPSTSHSKSFFKSLFVHTVDPPEVTEEPESKSVATGTDVKFAVHTTGDCLQFQWQKDGTDLSDDDKHFDTGTDSLHIVNVQKNDKGCYRCRVKNDVGEKLSKAALLTVSK